MGALNVNYINTLGAARCESHLEIIRDSKNKYFFQRSRIIMVEISRSRIIRITNYSARTYTYVYVRASPAAICIESDDDVVEPEVEKEKTQSSIEAPLPAGQVPSPRPRSEVRLGRSRSGKTSKRPVGSPLCVHESREQCSLTRTRCPMT